MNQIIIAGFFGGWEIILFGICGSYFIFWVLMLIDCANKETTTGTKTAWILILLLAGCISAPLYYFARKLPRDRRSKLGK